MMVSHCLRFKLLFDHFNYTLKSNGFLIFKCGELQTRIQVPLIDIASYLHYNLDSFLWACSFKNKEKGL
jgi:hypothetical protein